MAALPGAAVRSAVWATCRHWRAVVFKSRVSSTPTPLPAGRSAMTCRLIGTGNVVGVGMVKTGTVPLRLTVTGSPEPCSTSIRTALGATCGTWTMVGAVWRRVGASPLVPRIVKGPAALYWHSIEAPVRTWAVGVPHSIRGLLGVPFHTTGTPTSAPRWIRVPIVNVSGAYTVIVVAPAKVREADVIIETATVWVPGVVNVYASAVAAPAGIPFTVQVGVPAIVSPATSRGQIGVMVYGAGTLTYGGAVMANVTTSFAGGDSRETVSVQVTDPANGPPRVSVTVAGSSVGKVGMKVPPLPEATVFPFCVADQAYWMGSLAVSVLIVGTVYRYCAGGYA